MGPRTFLSLPVELLWNVGELVDDPNDLVNLILCNNQCAATFISILQKCWLNEAFLEGLPADERVVETPLVRAVRMHDESTVKHLLKIGANVRTTDLWFKTPGNEMNPLQHAVEEIISCSWGDDAFHGHEPELRVMQLLLEHGADANGGDIKPGALQEPPIFRAASHRRYKVVQHMLNRGANIHARYKGMTLLHAVVQTYVKFKTEFWPCEETRDAMRVFRLLVKKGADLAARNDRGKTPLESCPEAHCLPATCRYMARLRQVVESIQREEDESDDDDSEAELDEPVSADEMELESADEMDLEDEIDWEPEEEEAMSEDEYE